MALANNPDGKKTTVGRSAISDRPAAKDHLGFEPYVRAVAAFLTHASTQPPLTLSVEGTWGSGKSSFMLQLAERIRELGPKGVRTVWFNAWRYDRDAELWAAFAVEFTNKLAEGVPWWTRWLLHLKLSVLRFDWRRGWFRALGDAILLVLFIIISITVGRDLWNSHTPFSGLKTAIGGQKLDDTVWRLLAGSGYVGYIFAGIAVLRKIADLVGNPLRNRLTNYIRDPQYETRTAFLDSFHADFRRLVQTYARGCRVYVFVDDLDRCEIPKSAELMQAINLMMSESKSVFYILGLDRQKIAAGLAAKYKDLLPYLVRTGTPMNDGLAFGYSFLEKFIQIPFLLPQPTAPDVDELLDSLDEPVESGGGDRNPGPTKRVDAGLLIELGNDSEDVRSVVRMVAPALHYNPRRIKQFINLFRLRALLASQTGLFGEPTDGSVYDPLTLEQLGKLTAISLHWPELLDELQYDHDLLRRLQEYAWGTGKDSRTSADGWRKAPRLMELIAFPEQGTDVQDRTRYDLGRVDVSRFLQIAPVVPGRENGNGEFTAEYGNDVSGVSSEQFFRDSPNMANTDSQPDEPLDSPATQTFPKGAAASAGMSGAASGTTPQRTPTPRRTSPPARKKK